METTALLISLFSALAGAVLMAQTFAQLGYQPLNGGLLGALGGAFGAQIFSLPLNYCAFEPEQRAADVILGLILVAVGVALVILPLRWFVGRWARRHEGALVAGQHSQGVFKGRLTPFLLLAPTLTILVLFLYYPFFDTFRLSTLLVGRGAVARNRFLCLQNFTDLLYDPQYHQSVVVTFIIAFAIVFVGLAVALLIATLAYQPIKGANVYRTLLIWPYAVSPVVAGVIFQLMFDPAAGVINYFTNSLFGFKLDWLTNGTLATIAVILTSVWKTIGFNILFYIAGLQNVPKDLQEAAAVDGANVVQRFFRITWPLLTPITFFLVITNLTYAFFEIFGTIDYLTAGGPLNATDVMIYRVYELQSQTIGLGRAAAESLVLFLVVIGLTMIQFSNERRVNYGA